MWMEARLHFLLGLDRVNDQLHPTALFPAKLRKVTTENMSGRAPETIWTLRKAENFLPMQGMLIVEEPNKCI